ncbi:Rhomboid protease GlpG [Polystyrenella longa]|uniref:Rhomboid protease GlpG n=1 Tax=Polystyrenella longa TaxID=2528007 RepID=A0A518CH31_9PLAN|nr:rhomboid family intramembrane serine protease [Polystyrenella longa]QDU78533.1 Rhomboid protease GlpG [Polystyrenella longa]
MRLIGKLDSPEETRLFAEYLLSKKISSSVDQDDQGWHIWIIDEDQIDVARAELEAFKQDPKAEKFREGAIQGRKWHKEALKEERKQAARQVDVRRQWEPAHISKCPVTLFLIGLSILVGLLSSNFGIDVGAKRDTGPVPQMLFLNVDAYNLNPPDTIEGAVLHSASIHQYWRYITPIFIHFGILHILFNMMWMKDLGPTIESKIGSFQFLLMVLIIGLVSNLAQFVIDFYISHGVNPFFGGMSGVIFGLFGFIWLRGKLDPASGFFMPPRLLAFLVIFQVLCFLGILGNIANWAHLFGFISGAAIGGAPAFLRKAWRS